MKNAFVFTFIGLVVGGLFMNDKFTTPKASEDKTEIVYGTRVDSTGSLMLVTKR